MHTYVYTYIHMYMYVHIHMRVCMCRHGLMVPNAAIVSYTSNMSQNDAGCYLDSSITQLKEGLVQSPSVPKRSL